MLLVSRVNREDLHQNTLVVQIPTYKSNSQPNSHQQILARISSSAMRQQFAKHLRKNVRTFTLSKSNWKTRFIRQNQKILTLNALSVVNSSDCANIMLGRISSLMC